MGTLKGSIRSIDLINLVTNKVFQMFSNFCSCRLLGFMQNVHCSYQLNSNISDPRLTSLQTPPQHLLPAQREDVFSLCRQKVLRRSLRSLFSFRFFCNMKSDSMDQNFASSLEHAPPFLVSQSRSFLYHVNYIIAISKSGTKNRNY